LDGLRSAVCNGRLEGGKGADGSCRRQAQRSHHVRSKVTGFKLHAAVDRVRAHLLRRAAFGHVVHGAAGIRDRGGKNADLDGAVRGLIHGAVRVVNRDVVGCVDRIAVRIGRNGIGLHGSALGQLAGNRDLRLIVGQVRKRSVGKETCGQRLPRKGRIHCVRRSGRRRRLDRLRFRGLRIQHAVAGHAGRVRRELGDDAAVLVIARDHGQLAALIGCYDPGVVFIEKDHVAGPGAVTAVAPEPRVLQPCRPGITAGGIWELTFGDACIVQAERDEHRVPGAIGIAIPRAEAGIAVQRAVVGHGVVFRALPIAEL